MQQMDKVENIFVYEGVFIKIRPILKKSDG